MALVNPTIIYNLCDLVYDKDVIMRCLIEHKIFYIIYRWHEEFQVLYYPPNTFNAWLEHIRNECRFTEYCIILTFIWVGYFSCLKYLMINYSDNRCFFWSLLLVGSFFYNSNTIHLTLLNTHFNITTLQGINSIQLELPCQLC